MGASLDSNKAPAKYPEVNFLFIYQQSMFDRELSQPTRGMRFQNISQKNYETDLHCDISSHYRIIFDSYLINQKNLEPYLFPVLTFFILYDPSN